MAGVVRVEFNKSKDFRQVYALGATGGHTPYDFRIAFYNDSPKSFGEGHELKVIERSVETEIILSPSAAKELANWLLSHVSDYEKMFGQITQPKEVRKQPQKTETNSQIQGYM